MPSIVKMKGMVYRQYFSLLVPLIPFMLACMVSLSAMAHWPDHNHEHAHPHPASQQDAAQDTNNIDADLYPSLNDGDGYEAKANGSIRVGFGQSSIIPDFEMVMSYGSDVPTNEFYDTAKVKVLLFEVDERQFALIEYDVIGIQNEQAEAIKEAIAKRTPLKKRHLIVAATHNHSYGRTHKDTVSQLMGQRGIKACKEALESKFPAQIGFGKKSIPADLNLNRAELNGDANPLLYVIKIEDTTGHLRGVHYNYGSHPTVFTEWGSTRGKIGPNWPGYVNQYVQYRKRLDLLFERYSQKNGIETKPFVMFSEGAAGDQEPRDTDIYFNGERQPGNKVFMERLALQIIDLVEATPTQRQANIQFKAKSHKMALKNGKTYFTLLQSMVINNTALATIPGELNVELGYKFEKHSPYDQNILITNSDDYTGYIVREEMALEAVTYQSKGIPFQPHFGERMVDEAIELLDPEYEGSDPINQEKLYGSISGKVEYNGPNKIAIGAMRMPRTPNYAGGFFGQRTVVNADGTYTIDSLAPGEFFLYVMETDPENPAPKELKSGFGDLNALTYGVPVHVNAQATTGDVNFNFPEGYRTTGIQSIEISEEALSLDGYSLSGKFELKGKVREEDVIEVRAYPAHVHYKQLESFMQEPVITTDANAEGTFRFESLPEGQYHIAAFVDVNNNQRVEPGIDKITKPFDCPIIRVEGEPSNNKIGN